MTEVPRAVRRAVWVMCIAAGLSAINALVSLTLHDHIRAGIAQHSRTHPRDRMTAVEIDQAASTTVTVLVATAAVSVAVWLLMAYLNHQGRWWARICATVLTLLCLLQAWSFLTRGHPTVVAALLTILIVVASVVTTTLLWQRENAAHFGQTVHEPASSAA